MFFYLHPVKPCGLQKMLRGDAHLQAYFFGVCVAVVLCTQVTEIYGPLNVNVMLYSHTLPSCGSRPEISVE